MRFAFRRLIVTILSVRLVAAGNRSTTSTSNNVVWCGLWAGRPNLFSPPVPPHQIPPPDGTIRLFAEPQLQDPIFSPLPMAVPIVQIPKLFGRGGQKNLRNPGICSPFDILSGQFRLALMSFTSSQGSGVVTTPIGFSRWSDVSKAFDALMTSCVNQGTGGAILVLRK